MRYLPVRKPNRLKDYDYSRNGAYFITICTKNHEELFGRIVGEATCLPQSYNPNMEPAIFTRAAEFIWERAADCRPYGLSVTLSDIGHKIEIAINNISKMYSDTFVDIYVIMPNHIHMVLIIGNGDGIGDDDGIGNDNGRQVAAPTVSTIIGNMKRVVSIQCGFSPWQKSFHDRIIRDEEEYYRIAEYIEDNPEKWIDDCYYKKGIIRWNFPEFLIFL